MGLAFWKFPFTFDPAALKSDLAQVTANDWIPHFNVSYHDGGWSGVALRAPNGTGSKIYSGKSESDYVDTALLAGCPNFRQVISTFKCDLMSARLLKLDRGSGL